MTARTGSVVALAAVFTLLSGELRLGAQRVAPPDPVRATAPATSPAPPPVNIRINVVVTDSRGRPLVDLKPGISNSTITASHRRSPRWSCDARRPIGRGRSVTPIVTEEDERTAAQDPATRVFALFLDEFNVAPGMNSARVREAAYEVRDESSVRAICCYVLKPMDPVTGFRFTRDRAAAQREDRRGSRAARGTMRRGRLRDAVHRPHTCLPSTARARRSSPPGCAR